MTAQAPNQDIIDILTDALTRAQTGEIQEMFVWFKEADTVEHWFVTTDLPDLLYELGSVMLLLRMHDKEKPR